MLENSQKWPKIDLNLFRIFGPTYNRNGLCSMTSRFSTTIEHTYLVADPRKFYHNLAKMRSFRFSVTPFSILQCCFGADVYVSSFANGAFICGSTDISLFVTRMMLMVVTRDEERVLHVRRLNRDEVLQVSKLVVLMTLTATARIERLRKA